MANMHHTPSKIDFLKLQNQAVDSNLQLQVYLFAGKDISPSELFDCKKRLEYLAPPSVKILGTDEHLESPDLEVRKIGIILESLVSFHPIFFEHLFSVFGNTETFCLYSDFWRTTNGEQKEIKLPAWSPIRFESVDFLGPALTFDLSKYLSFATINSVTREKIIEFAQIDNLRISRVPHSLYSGAFEFPKVEVIEGVSDSPETVSVIIPTQGLVSGNNSLLETCVASLVSQIGISTIELIVVVDKGYDLELLSRIKRMLPENFTYKLIEFSEPFNFSRKCNFGAAQATGEVIVFLNDDVELNSADAIAVLSGWANLPEMGAVGSQLQFADGSIQHAGITLNKAKPKNSYLDQFGRDTDFGDLQVPHEVSGVAGACLALRHDVFSMAGGWNEDLPNSYNDVDLCLRLNNMGFQSLLLNHLHIIHNESSSRDAEFDAMAFETLMRLWPNELRGERYLRSDEANGGYGGPWGTHRDERIDFSGDFFGYSWYLISSHGTKKFISAVIGRLSGKTSRLLDLPKKEYL